MDDDISLNLSGVVNEIEPLSRSGPVASSIARRLHAQILSGTLQPGARLPTIPDLARQFDVSVAGVREALAALDGVGLIEIRHGHGTFVRERPPLEPALAGWLGFGSDKDEMDGLVEARSLIELHLSELAAQRATPEEGEALWAAVDAMDAAKDDPQAFLEADAAFHLLVARAAHSPVLHRIVAALGTVLRQQISTNIDRALEGPDGLESSVKRHRDVAAAIIGRDREKAREAMSLIIERVAELAGLDEVPPPQRGQTGGVSRSPRSSHARKQQRS